MRTVTLVTDMADVGIEEVKRQIIRNSIDPVEFNVASVKPFSLIHGSFTIRLLSEIAEENDIFICVLDPRIPKTRRNSLVIGTKRKNLKILGPNNGVFAWVIQDFGVSKAVELPTRDVNKLYPTFNGKYKFAPATRDLLSKKPISALGRKFNPRLFTDYQMQRGTILHVDNFGNIKLFGDRLHLVLGTKLGIEIGNKTFDSVFVSDYDQAEAGELVVYNGSSLHGLPEVAIVRGNAAEFLNVDIGDKISISSLQRDDLL